MTEQRRGDDENDPSDWLSRQFAADEEQVEPEPPALDNPLADPSLWSTPRPAQTPVQPSAESQGGFDWGFGSGKSAASPPPPVAPIPPDPFPAPPSSTPGPPITPPPAFPPDAPAPATQASAAAVPPAADAPTEAFVARDVGPKDPPPASGIDALFGDSQFKEYEDQSVLATIPFGANAPAGAQKQKREPGAPLSKNQKILFWVAGGMVGVLALITCFVVGTRLPELLGAAPAVTASATPTPTPTATVRPVGPLAAGTYEWNELLGGECLDPYSSPWEEEFTVVDCTVPHPAQLVFRGTFPTAVPAPAAGAGEAGVTETGAADGAGDPYPGVDALQAQINLLCTAAGVIDLAVAGQFSDIQFQASFAATEQQWNDGDHDYYCFVSRSSAEPLTVSLAVPPPPAAPAA
ncbi:hypothetical protein BH09ACT3_BH09ACT3_11980 [soil metagenome]